MIMCLEKFISVGSEVFTGKQSNKEPITLQEINGRGSRQMEGCMLNDAGNKQG